MVFEQFGAQVIDHEPAEADRRTPRSRRPPTHGEIATAPTQMYTAYITMNGLNGPPVMSSNPVSNAASAASATPTSADGGVSPRRRGSENDDGATNCRSQSEPADLT